MRPSSRAVIAAAAVAVFLLCEPFLAGEPSQPAPAIDLTKTPNAVANWIGQAPRPQDGIPAPPEDSLGSIQRTYTSADGHRLFLELDAFDAAGLVHPPEVCSLANGASSIDSQDFPLEAAGRTATARLLTTYDTGRRQHVLYWFQLGPYVFCDWSGFFRAAWELGKQRQAYHLLRVMVQAPAGVAGAEQRLRKFAQPLLAWTLTLP